jgi:2-alkyl-3-oxoalkanoate reductase
MRIFLTGGTGLIGSHVAERLRHRGDTVVALVRGTSNSAHLAGVGCKLVEGDILDPPESLASAMAGCDLVIHAAAKVFEKGSREDFVRLNVRGTETVLGAAALTAPRVVHLSSVAVYAGVRPEPALTEERWTEADPDRQGAYAASKHLSEQAAWRLHQRGLIQLTTVRPSVVYGERDRAATPILIRLVSLPIVPLPGGGKSRLTLVYAGNVARGVVAAADRPTTIGRAYNLALDHPVTLRELTALLSDALGRRHRTLSVPAAPLNVLAEGVEWLTRLVPILPRTGVRRAIRSLTRDNPYSSGRAGMELGWANLITHREGVRRTVEWWCHRSETDE